MRKRKNWLSIILMLFIILFVGCESKSDYVKKGINKQDDLLEIEESVLEIKEVVLPSDDEKIENIHENLQDDRKVDTRDYSAFLNKIWKPDGWAGSDDVIRFISFVITYIENGEVKGYLDKDNGWVDLSYFRLNEYDEFPGDIVEFHGEIYDGIAECEYIDMEGENRKFSFSLFDNNEVKVVVDEDETQSYLLVPYNISDEEFVADSVVIEEVEIDSWGKVNLFYAVLDNLHSYPWILLINEQGDILYHFSTGYHNDSKVKEVIINDMNGDGLKDVEVVTYFGDTDGYRFEWYFYQGENGLFSLQRTYFYEGEDVFLERIENDGSEE